ncbi:MAG: hypothetical protein Q9183_003268 [Haloplaca sp. 2 TL-2023]
MPDRIWPILGRVIRECEDLDELPQPVNTTSLAIRALVEMLASAVSDLADIKPKDALPLPRLTRHPFLHQRFLSNGWCPRQVQMTMGRYSSSGIYYLSSLPRLPTFGGVLHGECDESRCTSASVDPKSYQPRHARACIPNVEACGMVGVQSSAVAACIQRGHIPLIRFQKGLNGVLEPELIESRGNLRYVALSHVWSGGLGNVNANSILTCQLRTIRDVLYDLRRTAHDELDKNLGGRKFDDLKQALVGLCGFQPPEQPLLLWMDTLCVPVGAEHKEARQAALAQMAQIYVQAQCVLVLDPELQQTKHQGLPDEQIFASVLSSSWSSRSWTFQEACMARVFYVQFADGHCVIDKRWHDFMRRSSGTQKLEEKSAGNASKDFGLHDKMMLEMSHWFGEMPVMTKIRGYDSRTLMTNSEDWRNFGRVWNGLRTRSTTKTEDIYGIMAIMVDLSAHEILSLRPEERMKAILRSQSTLPLSLLYQDGPKVHVLNGNPLWAPSAIAGGHLDLDGAYVHMQGNGLLLNLQEQTMAQHAEPNGYVFSATSPLPASFVLDQAERGMILSVTIRQYDEEQITSPTKKWVILFDAPIHHAALLDTKGVLLALREAKDSTLVVKYCAPVKLSTKTWTESLSREDERQTALGCRALGLRDHVIFIESGRQNKCCF